MSSVAVVEAAVPTLPAALVKVTLKVSTPSESDETFTLLTVCVVEVTLPLPVADPVPTLLVTV